MRRVDRGELNDVLTGVGGAGAAGIEGGAAAVSSGAPRVGPPAALAQARGWLLGSHHPGALLLLGAEPQAPLARTPRIADGGRADSGGVVSGADCAWAQMGSTGGLGAGPAGSVAGLRPENLRDLVWPHEEAKGATVDFG
jgi:hypothetical protein